MKQKTKINIPPALSSLSDAELAQIFECSRQAVLIARRRQNHQCVKCGKPIVDGSQHCAKHKLKMRRYQRSYGRIRNGFKPWQAGSRGRKPLEAA